MIVNGALLKIAAFPESSNVRALPGFTGFNCCLLVSNTKTLLMFLFAPLRASGFPGDGSLDDVRKRF